VLASVVFVFCKKDELAKHLENYDEICLVNETLIEGIELKKFAIIKTGQSHSVLL